jgi:signal recognition particle receptor subunit beta
VLICGPCDSGKTTLLSQLVLGKPVLTYTSMVLNTIPWQVEGRPSINLLDVPGHERIRGSVVEEFSSSARGILYVVDSNTVAKQVRDVAQFLHTILSNKAVNKNR